MTLESRRGVVRSIWIATDKGVPMVSLNEVLAERRGGLRHPEEATLVDRYHAQVKLGAFSSQGRGTTRDVSLISTEALELAGSKDGAPRPVDMPDTRRNIEVEGLGLDLTEFMHKAITIGGATLYIMGPCSPCERPNKLANRQDSPMASFKDGFGEGRGGVRAMVTVTGLISVENEVIVEST